MTKLTGLILTKMEVVTIYAIPARKPQIGTLGSHLGQFAQQNRKENSRDNRYWVPLLTQPYPTSIRQLTYSP